MLFVGLTGGIGSGKSTVAAHLADRGAVIMDADAYAREASASTSPQFPEILALFGPGFLQPDGELDRAAVAAIVFSDPGRLRGLEAIIHPVVNAKVEAGRASHAGTDTVLVLDSPLLIQTRGQERCDAVVLIACSIERRLERLAVRGMGETDARARIAAQPTEEDIAAFADHVLDNDGTPDELLDQVDRLWSDLLRDLHAQGGNPG